MKEKSRKRKVKKEDLESALIKKALGYDCTETIEEYAGDEQGEVRLLKKKVTIKNVPPDVSALKILLEERQKDIDQMTDEELDFEKQRLMKLIQSSLIKKEKKIEQNDY